MWSRAEEQSLPPTESPLCARYCVHVMSSNPQGNSRKTDVQSTDKETDAQWWEAGHGSRPCRFPALKSLIDWLTCSSFLSFILQIFIVLSSEGGIWFFCLSLIFCLPLTGLSSWLGLSHLARKNVRSDQPGCRPCEPGQHQEVKGGTVCWILARKGRSRADFDPTPNTITLHFSRFLLT